MKKINTVLQYIIALILALAIIALILINIFSSTVLNENYIISKLDEENYYDKMYEEIESNFENYINQSGLDEEVLNDIITKEKIEKDTKIIIQNIFLGNNEKISTDEIKDKLTQNINVSLKRKLTSTEQESVNSFINTICDEYTSTILNTKYENSIYSTYSKVTEYFNLFKKILIITSIVCVILIVILSIKQIYNVFSRAGVALTISGLLLIVAKCYVVSKVRIGDITILNNPISIVLRNILTDILNIINRYGSVLLVLGIISILFYAFIKSIIEAKKIKEQYTPEK